MGPGVEVWEPAPFEHRPAQFHGKGIELHRGFGGLVGRFGGCPSPGPAEQARCDEAEVGSPPLVVSDQIQKRSP